MTLDPQQHSTQPAGPDHTRRSAQSAIIAVCAVLGGVILLGALFALAITVFAGNSASDQSIAADTSQITGVEVDMSAGEFDLTYADIDEAQLEAVNARATWVMEERNGVLVVTDRRDFWQNLCFGWCEHQQVTLTLPDDLQSITDFTGDLSISAGRLNVEGSYAELSVDLSAGDVTLNAEARTLHTDVSAGNIRGTVNGVTLGDIEVSAGSTTLQFTGDTPDNLVINVSAGEVKLQLPDAAYRVTSDVSAGDLTTDVRTSPDSPHIIDVDVSAGSVRLFN